MNDRSEKNEIKMPLQVTMDMAKMEIGSHAFNCMNNNNIPRFLMVYILKDILLDFIQMKELQLSEEFLKNTNGCKTGGAVNGNQ